MSGRTIKEQLASVFHTPHSTMIIKATDSTRTKPKRKHVQMLMRSLTQHQTDVAHIARKLAQRVNSVANPHAEGHVSSAVIALKSLVVTHALLRVQDQRLIRALALPDNKFMLDNFLDGNDTAISILVRKYSKYLTERVGAFVALGGDVIGARDEKKILQKVASDDASKNFEMIKSLQAMMDALLLCCRSEGMQVVAPGHAGLVVDYQFTSFFLTSNPPVEACATMLAHDARVLFRVITSVLVPSIEQFFDMNKKNATTALQQYETYLDECEALNAFFRVARDANVSQQDLELADVSTGAPKALLAKMREHIKNYAMRTQSFKATASAFSTPTLLGGDVVAKFEQQAVPFNPLPPSAPTSSTASPALARKERPVSPKAFGDMSSPLAVTATASMAAAPTASVRTPATAGAAARPGPPPAANAWQLNMFGDDEGQSMA